jgi:hypothetical protein
MFRRLKILFKLDANWGQEPDMKEIEALADRATLLKRVGAQMP